MKIGQRVTIPVKHSKWLISHLGMFALAGDFTRLYKNKMYLAEIAAHLDAVVTNTPIKGVIRAFNGFSSKHERAYKVVSKRKGIAFWSWYEPSALRRVK